MLHSIHSWHTVLAAYFKNLDLFPERTFTCVVGFMEETVNWMIGITFLEGATIKHQYFFLLFFFYLTFLLWKAPLSVTLCPLYYNIFVLFINSCLMVENMIVVFGKEAGKHKLLQWKFSEHLLCARPWVRYLGTDKNKTQCLSLWVSGPSWETVT